MFEKIVVNSSRWLEEKLLKNEIFKVIKENENYAISNYGRIKSLKRNKILTNKTTGNYNHIILFKDNKKKNYLIHRLVAEAFIPNIENLPQINHKDENKRNNCVDNLEWCSSSYNINYGNRKRKVINAVKKSINQYSIDGEFIKKWEVMNDAIRFYNNKHITDVCKGRRKVASGFIWKYCDNN